MRLKHIRVIARIAVPAGVGPRVLAEYRLGRQKIAMRQVPGPAPRFFQKIVRRFRTEAPLWLDADSHRSIPADIIDELVRREHPAFTACVIWYDCCEPDVQGIDRKRALSVIQKAGLVPPSTFQTILLAARTVYTAEIPKILVDAHAGSRVTAVTPIHPEAPCFYCFGRGYAGEGSFQRKLYEQSAGRLHFERGLAELSKHNLPLLLGIEPSREARI